MTAQRKRPYGSRQCRGGCGRWLTYGGRGRPPVWCDDCNPRRIRPERQCAAPVCDTVIPRGTKRLTCSEACYMRFYRAAQAEQRRFAAALAEGVATGRVRECNMTDAEIRQATARGRERPADAMRPTEPHPEPAQ